MEILLGLCLGVTLSAACGFRVFIPPLAMSMGAIFGDFQLASGFEWLGTYPALITLGIAAVVEILAYYIPVVDNLLDTIEIPTAIAIGTIIVASTLTEVDPILQWTIAAIAGGGSAGVTEGVTSMTRLASTGLTGGVANPLLATMEDLSAVILSILALLAPVLAAVVVTVVLVWASRKLIKLWQKRYRRSHQ